MNFSMQICGSAITGLKPVRTVHEHKNNYLNDLFYQNQCRVIL